MNIPAKEWWDLAFVLLMLSWPAPAILWWKSLQLKDATPEVRAHVNDELRPIVRLFLAMSLGALLVLLGWTILALQQIYPFGRYVPVFWPVFGAFHLVWWPFAMPIMNKLNRLLEESGIVAPFQQTEAVRTAPLTPRRLRDYMPRYGLSLVIALAVAGPVCILFWFLWRPIEQSMEVFSAATFAATGAGTLFLWMFCMRFALTERLPAGQGADESDPEKERRFRIRAMFWLMIGMATVFYGCSVMVLEIGRGTISASTVGLIGGSIGAATGLAGGILGVTMSLRIHRLRKNRT